MTANPSLFRRSPPQRIGKGGYPRGPKGEKHPADVNARAAMIARIATGEVDEARPGDGDKFAAVGQFARPKAPLLQDKQTITV